VVTASEDKTARLWEAATGRCLVELRGHEERVNSAVFSPDGALVVTASDDGRARVWQAAPAKLVAETKRHGTWLGMGWVPVVGAAFLPDGSLVATTARDKKVRMWEPATGKFKGELEKQDAFAVRAYCSPGGQGLLVEHKDGWGRIPKDIQTGKLWAALRTFLLGKLLAALADEDLMAVPEPSFSADGKRAVTAHDDGLARVWETATGALVRELEVHKGVPVRAVAFHPHGTWVATVVASDARVWDVESARVVAELRGHGSLVNSVAFSPDGRWAVTASDDCTARVWQAP
jgi:WD40 repeat protein